MSLIAILLLMLLPLAIATVWRTRQVVRAVEQDVLRARLQTDEFRRVIDGREKWRSAQKVAEKSVDVSTDTVRLAHNLIAAIPFSVLENIPATREGAKAARKTHDRITGGVYDSITIANKLIGHGLRQTLGSDAKRNPPKKKDTDGDPSA